MHLLLTGDPAYFASMEGFSYASVPIVRWSVNANIPLCARSHLDSLATLLGLSASPLLRDRCAFADAVLFSVDPKTKRVQNARSPSDGTIPTAAAAVVAPLDVSCSAYELGLVDESLVFLTARPQAVLIAEALRGPVTSSNSSSSTVAAAPPFDIAERLREIHVTCLNATWPTLTLRSAIKFSLINCQNGHEKCPIRIVHQNQRRIWRTERHRRALEGVQGGSWSSWMAVAQVVDDAGYRAQHHDEPPSAEDMTVRWTVRVSVQDPTMLLSSSSAAVFHNNNNKGNEDRHEDNDDDSGDDSDDNTNDGEGRSERSNSEPTTIGKRLPRVLFGFMERERLHEAIAAVEGSSASAGAGPVSSRLGTSNCAWFRLLDGAVLTYSHRGEPTKQNSNNSNNKAASVRPLFADAEYVVRHNMTLTFVIDVRLKVLNVLQGTRVVCVAPLPQGFVSDDVLEECGLFNGTHHQGEEDGERNGSSRVPSLASRVCMVVDVFSTGTVVELL